MLRKTQIGSLHFHFHSTNTHMWKILTLHCGVTFSLPRLHYHFNVVPYRLPTLHVFVMIDYRWYCHSVHSRALPSITHLSLYLIWALPAAVVAGNSVIFNNQICSAASLFYVCWATCHRDTDWAVRHHCRGQQLCKRFNGWVQRGGSSPQTFWQGQQGPSVLDPRSQSKKKKKLFSNLQMLYF